MINSEVGLPPYLVWNMKKLRETIDADFDDFNVQSAACKEKRTTT